MLLFRDTGSLTATVGHSGHRPPLVSRTPAHLSTQLPNSPKRSRITQEMRGLAKLKAAYLKHEFGPPAQWDKLYATEKPKKQCRGG
jgi:hypothetical protein